MNPHVLAAALASAQASHAAIVTRAKASSGETAEQLWTIAGAAHRQTANLCVMLATASLERES